MHKTKRYNIGISTPNFAQVAVCTISVLYKYNALSIHDDTFLEYLDRLKIINYK